MPAPSSVYFAHGKESGPWGRKITALAAVAEATGLTVASPDYRFTRDPRERIRHLHAQDPPRGERLILVGSSMGGYVAAMASHALRPAGLFLIAPALYMPGYEGEPQPGTGRVEVVHGWRDEIIPVEHSWRFARRHRASLHVLAGGHTLRHHVAELESLFAAFLQRVCADAGGTPAETGG